LGGRTAALAKPVRSLMRVVMRLFLTEHAVASKGRTNKVREIGLIRNTLWRRRKRTFQGTFTRLSSDE
jgi:hypothetical protein